MLLTLRRIRLLRPRAQETVPMAEKANGKAGQKEKVRVGTRPLILDLSRRLRRVPQTETNNPYTTNCWLSSLRLPKIRGVMLP